MTNKEKILHIYKTGFADELSNKAPTSFAAKIYQRAYEIGRIDALMGDELANANDKSDDAILQQICTGSSYRESFGLDLPPANTIVKIEYMEGCKYYILWPTCPDGENILYQWLSSKNNC